MTKSAFPIVGIGASAGGLDAFNKFFGHMPADCGMAFVIILHLPRDHKSMLPEILARWTSMQVLEGVAGTLIKPNCVYVPPPHAIVSLKDGRLGVQFAPDDQRVPRPIEAFFDSLGSSMGEQSIGIVLSGTGSDGALGLKAIKECGGLTIAQGSNGTAPQYGEMPAGAITTGSVDLVAQIEDIPGHLIRIKGEHAFPYVDEQSVNTIESARLPTVERESVIVSGGDSPSTLSGPPLSSHEAPAVSSHGKSTGSLLPHPWDGEAAASPAPTELQHVKQELLRWQEQYQSLTEQHQTALEELRSSHEELHSVNEELHAVNSQLSDKVGELDESNSDLRNLFETTEIATIFLDRNLLIRSFTRAITALYNLIPSDEGRPLTDIVSRLDYWQLREDVTRVLETLEPLDRRIARQDRSTHYIMRILPYREPDHTVSGVLVTFVDVTSIVQAESALREADVRKDVFLATLSHELRNPLAPIRTAARLLEASNIAPAQLARAQAIISRQVSHMSSLLDDLLDVARITRGSFPLKKELIDIKSLIEAAVEAAQPGMTAKRHTLRVEIPENPILVNADSVRLTQVLSNLLTNAAKYTPVGGVVTIGCRLDAQDFTVFVRDNGIGLSPEVIPRIFEMFTQIESEGAASEGGLGIGLALTKGLVQLHGGRITAKSAGLGKGSEFAICLPRSLIVEASQAFEKANGEASPRVSRRVLVADDNRDGAESLSMLLELSGHEVYLAHSGTQALEVANKIRPHVAVLDIGMPDLSGYEVAERIRLEPWGDRITLIALTGWGQENDKRRAESAGFDHHCTKPVDLDDLQRFFEDAPGEASCS